MGARTNYVIGAVVAVAAIGGTVLLVNWNANREAADSHANEATETEDGISVSEAVAAIEATSTVEESGLEDIMPAAEPVAEAVVAEGEAVIAEGEAVITEAEAETPALDTAIVTDIADETAETVETLAEPAETQPE